MNDHLIEPLHDGPTAQAGGRMHRRAALRRTLGGALALGGGLVTFPLHLATRTSAEEPAENGLIVRNQRPIDLESPVSALDHWLTPNDLFFVRSHFGVPAVGLSPWQLEVGGLLDHPGTFALDDLRFFETVTVPAVLECTGNGRAYFRPRIPGVVWERGAVGHAEWSGVRLADVLKRAGLQAGSAHVQLQGSDGPPLPKTPAFFRSIPLERALHPSTLIATRMNGAPLPLLHGGPLRLVVPGWMGNHWIKWLRKITVAREEAPGFYMQTGYRMPKVPAPSGAVLKPSDLVPVTTMNVKSLITWPSAGTTLGTGAHEVRGVAWTGDGHVTKVEFSTERHAVWDLAHLRGDERPGSWRPWSVIWSAAPGKHTLRVRATDSNGQTQPQATPWNRSGYLWNGIDQVSVEVREV